MRAYFFNMIAMNALAALRALPPLSSVLIGHGPYLLAFHLILDAFFNVCSIGAWRCFAQIAQAHGVFFFVS
jgi:hypothetical protein